METITLVYIGYRMNGDTLSSTFIKDGESDKEDNYKFFKKNKLPIGCKYEAEIEGDHTLLKTSKVLEDIVTNKTLLTKWAAQSKAAEGKSRVINSKKRAESILVSTEVKDELKRIVSNLNDSEVRYFLEELIWEIRTKESQEEFSRRLNASLMKKIKKPSKP